jgi:hypothetical protein
MRKEETLSEVEKTKQYILAWQKHLTDISFKVEAIRLEMINQCPKPLNGERYPHPMDVNLILNEGFKGLWMQIQGAVRIRTEEVIPYL